MSILGRFSDIVSMNMHAWLDRAENPERVLQQVLRVMDDEIATAHSRAAQCIAAERRLRRELDKARTAATHWKDRARFALAQRREDLARRALVHKLDRDDQATALDAELRTVSGASAEVKASLRALKSRIAEARQRQAVLIAGQRAAEVRLAVEQAVHGSFANLASRLERAQRHLVEREDELLAQLEVSRGDDDLGTELNDLEREKRLADEMNALKREAFAAP